MKKQTIVAILFIGITVILGVLGVFLLPETVVTQISLGGSGASTMPKALAIFIPCLLGIGGGVGALSNRFSKENGGKCLILSGAGIAVLALMLLFNH